MGSPLVWWIRVAYIASLVYTFGLNLLIIAGGLLTRFDPDSPDFAAGELALVTGIFSVILLGCVLFFHIKKQLWVVVLAGVNVLAMLGYFYSETSMIRLRSGEAWTFARHLPAVLCPVLLFVLWRRWRAEKQEAEDEANAAYKKVF